MHGVTMLIWEIRILHSGPFPGMKEVGSKMKKNRCIGCQKQIQDEESLVIVMIGKEFDYQINYRNNCRMLFDLYLINYDKDDMSKNKKFNL